MSEQPRPIESGSPFEPGSVIDDRYEIVEFLGEGGFATVYKARHIHINRMLAIKILNTGLKVPKSSEFEQRFLREAQTAAQIHHANVVTIHDFGFAGPGRQPYIVMELLKGHDLEAELAKNGRLDPSRVVRLFAPCLEALGEGHKAGIVHKDLKPSNLFLCHPREPKETLQILDFGVASISEGGKRLTSTGQILGTPQYLAPEYIKSQISLPQLDVYQMGLILVEALTGKPVVDGESPFQCLMVHCSGNLPLPESLLNGPLGPVLRKALHLDYEQRYADAAAFRTALLAVDLSGMAALTPGELETLGRLETSDSNASIGETMPSLDAPVLEPGSATMRPSPNAIPTTAHSIAQPREVGPAADASEEVRPKRSPALLFGLVFAIALMLGVLVVLLARGGGEETAPTPEATTTSQESEKTDPATPDPPANGGPSSDPIAAKNPGEPEPADPDPSDKQPELADSNPSGKQGSPEQTAAGIPDPVPSAKVRVFVVSEPTGAEVFDGDKLLATTPAVIEVEAGGPITWHFQRNGYEKEETKFEPKDGATISAKLRKVRGDGTKTRRRTGAETTPGDPQNGTVKPKDDKPKDDKPKDDKPKDDKPKDIMLIAP